MEKKKKTIFILIGILIFVAIIVNIILQSAKAQKKQEEENIKNEIAQDPRTEKTELEKLKKMGERDRMESYFSEYISYVEQGHYDLAYNLLYPEFKENYFKTLEEYITYVKDKYPSMIGINHTDIERQGKYYVLFIEIYDPLKPKTNQEKLEQRIVVYEKDFNDFVLSFSV